MNHILKILTIIALLTVTSLTAQEIDCDVKLNVESLTAEGRENLTDFADQVKQYINGHKWTKEDFGGLKIRCNIEIYILGVSDNNHYTARAFIGSQRPIYKADKNSVTVRFLDEKWEFDYVRNQSMIHDDYVFDPLLSFLDYYVYTILGFDFDSYKALDGTRFFEKAMDLVNKSRGTGRSGPGWESTSQTQYSRGQLAEELLNPQYKDIRKAYYTYHYNGLDLLDSKRDKAQANIIVAIESIGKLKDRLNQQTLLMKLFFDMKSQELAESLLGYFDRSVYEKFARIDPAHQKTYEEHAMK